MKSVPYLSSAPPSGGRTVLLPEARRGKATCSTSRKAAAPGHRPSVVGRERDLFAAPDGEDRRARVVEGDRVLQPKPDSGRGVKPLEEKGNPPVRTSS